MKPVISVIVPVYNCQKYLPKMLQSLVYQTLKNIEIILVNDGSTDASLTILKEYEEKFSDKIKVFSIENVGQGEARNYGIKQARAEYLAFCDADDYYDLHAMELFYEKVVEDDYDMVYAPHLLLSDKKGDCRGEMPEDICDTTNFILYGEVAFWSKLIHKRIFEKIGPIPSMWHEDTAYGLASASYCEKIAYINKPLYYYIKHDGSITRSVTDPRTLDTIKAEQFALEHCNFVYQKAVAARIAKRILFNLSYRWIYGDAFLEHLRELQEYLIENPYLETLEIGEQVQGYLGLPYGYIPKIVYLGGGENSRAKLEQFPFLSRGETVLLDELSYPISENSILQKAIEENRIEFLIEYFGLKSVYEKGGIYIG